MSLLVSKGASKSDMFLLQGFVHACLSCFPRWPEKFRILIPGTVSYEFRQEIPGTSPSSQEESLYFFFNMLIIVQKGSTKKNLLAPP